MRKAQAEHVISAEERRLWERMTFRQFALLIIRLQAVWLLFNAVLYATYLPRYFIRGRETFFFNTFTPDVKFDLFFAILRILLHVAAAVAIIAYAERLLSWLVKDWVATKPSDASSQPAVVAPTDSNRS
jgi:hypothetical protein